MHFAVYAVASLPAARIPLTLWGAGERVRAGGGERCANGERERETGGAKKRRQNGGGAGKGGDAARALRAGPAPQLEY